MKILHVNYHAKGGGAAIAAGRLHAELRTQGVDSEMLVVDTGGESIPGVSGAGASIHRFCAVAQRVERLLLRLDGDSRTCLPRSLNLFRSGIVSQINAERPDLVHLHWIHGGMIGVGELAQISAPIVWTLHDAWAYCGGEHHHAAGDERFRTGYQTGRDFWNVWNWKRKTRCWDSLSFQPVCPSRWLTGEAMASVLLAHRQPRCIPNGVDLTIFCPGNREEARKKLKLPASGRLILFGAASAADPNKGGREFLEALRHLAVRQEFHDVFLLWLGKGAPPKEMPFPVLSPGFISDERELAECYRAADLFVLASKFDNLPNMLIEASACGTPLAAFDTGGISDIVRPGVNGILAKPFVAQDLAEAMAAILSAPQDELRAGARSHAETHFDIRKGAEQYLELYRSILMP